MVLNPKIIKVNTAIDKTKEQIAELNSKLKDLERQKTQLENDEIVAMFRREKLNEDEFAALLQSGRKATAQQQPTKESLQEPFSHEPPETQEAQTTSGTRKEVDADDVSEV